jgi:epoxyqueuosine reductase
VHNSRLSPFINRIGMWLAQPAILARLRYLPELPSWFRRHYAPKTGTWPPQKVRVPTELLSVAGIKRDPEAESATFATEPLHDLRRVYPRLTSYALQHMWSVSLGVSPRMQRASRRSVATAKAVPMRRTDASVSPQDLTQLVREKATELGLSAIGIAQYDPKYTYSEHRDECSPLGDRVIVCMLEQHYEATQTAPSARSERGALSAYADVMKLGAQLAEHLHVVGYRAAAEPQGGHGMALHYAVAAGLGQLGLNGQVLTPHAGSRCRITLVQTDAPLIVDHPVDYGIPKLCDSCKVCVQRCPVGAIPANRAMHRGIEKAKINTARCWPVVAQAHGCAICMKVCPVQRYGLQPVLDEFERSGQILGKNTDELEGFTWIDGRRYGHGERPRLPVSFTKPSDFPMAVLGGRHHLAQSPTALDI